MTQTQSIFKLFHQLWLHLSKGRHHQILLLLLLMVLSSLMEVMSIGSILPFLGALASPARVFDSPVMAPFIRLMNINSPDQLLLPLTITFIALVSISNITRACFLWLSTKLSFATGADLSVRMYRQTLHQSYSALCSRNTSAVINDIAVKGNEVIYNILYPALTLISSAITLAATLCLFLALNPTITIAIFGGFGILYLAVVRFTQKRLVGDGKIIARQHGQIIKVLQEGLGGIRDVLLDGTQDLHIRKFEEVDSPLRKAQGVHAFIAQAPRYGIEGLGMIFIALLAYYLSIQPEGIMGAIPLLGLLAIGAQRFLPVMQQAFGSWTLIKGHQTTLSDVLTVLDLPVNDVIHSNFKKMPFKFSINIRALNFCYREGSAYVLHDINLEIKKGSRVGFMGTTGSGKSTLIDLLMGLLEPTSGVLEVDGISIWPDNQRSWQDNIAHVPQNIFLSDSTIEENIAFGVAKEEINYELVRQVAIQAQIAETIEGFDGKYKTLVGERGVRLSGGQRQRIGIARALYKKANIIIFDEATSALDGETESAVMQAIDNLSADLTVIIIAHRISTLSNCSQIIELSEGRVKNITIKS